MARYLSAIVLPFVDVAAGCTSGVAGTNWTGFFQRPRPKARCSASGIVDMFGSSWRNSSVGCSPGAGVAEGAVIAVATELRQKLWRMHSLSFSGVEKSDTGAEEARIQSEGLLVKQRRRRAITCYDATWVAAPLGLSDPW